MVRIVHSQDIVEEGCSFYDCEVDGVDYTYLRRLEERHSHHEVDIALLVKPRRQRKRRRTMTINNDNGHVEAPEVDTSVADEGVEI